MIIAGPCLLTCKEEIKSYIELSKKLVGIADKFRVKLWGGGTTPDNYCPGLGFEGLPMISRIRENLPVGTEVQTESQYSLCIGNMDYIWLGARNCQNYGIRDRIGFFDGDVMVKRGPWLSVFETINLYDTIVQRNGIEPYIIERGIVTFDRLESSKWAPDLKGVINIKHSRPDIFEKIIIDCSHSVFVKDYVGDVYTAFKSIGVNHFMFECTLDGKSVTDQAHMLSVDELGEIIG